MLYQVAQGCGISSGPGCFRAVDLSDENGCQIDVVVFAFNGGSGENLSVLLEGSNDGENWSTTGTTEGAITFADGATPELGTKTGRFSGLRLASYAQITRSGEPRSRRASSVSRTCGSTRPLLGRALSAARPVFRPLDSRQEAGITQCGSLRSMRVTARFSSSAVGLQHATRTDQSVLSWLVRSIASP